MVLECSRLPGRTKVTHEIRGQKPPKGKEGRKEGRRSTKEVQIEPKRNKDLQGKGPFLISEAFLVLFAHFKNECGKN
jgi:hypothetical protein